jgi:transposase
VLYRARNRIERFFNRIKNFRRLAICYEKLASNFLTMPNWLPSTSGCA